MSEQSPESLISVYSTPLAFDAELVKAMLADDGIPSFVEESNSPFAGLNSIPCHVLVEAEHETLARQLIGEHEAKHRERVERETELTDEPLSTDDDDDSDES